MVEGQGPYQYAQVGYGRSAGESSPQAFVEYDDGTTIYAQNHWFRIEYPGIWSSGVRHAYAVDLSLQTDRFYLSIDGVTKASTPWIPDSVWVNSDPWIAEFKGETLDRGDDIPGTAAARDDYTAVAVRHCAGCLWQAPVSNSIQQDESYYKFVWSTNPTSFQIYTQR